MKTHWKKAFDSPYLGSWDLEDYQDLILTIDHIKVEMTVGLKEDMIKTIGYFKEKGFKPMILNSTNCKAIRRAASSPYHEDWKGARITLYVEEVKAFGELHDALRIRKTAPPKPILNPQHPNWEKVRAKKPTIEVLRKHYNISDNDYKLLSKN